MITFITDCRGESEPEILPGVAGQPLVIKSLQGKHLLDFPAPAGGWTHQGLCDLGQSIETLTTDGADAFVGGEWVGSTEV
ncbi:hypothetical protein Q1Z72_01450 [Pseudomonas qingdaonensis]|uniref:hypothetical protein n=1 Tax=Pseudomonas TaxID=286 RepID=UPI0021175F9D|nr:MULTISPECIES: hypothetical protein [Pseudomonas]UXH55937.1 hypothetical protein N5876_32840 [Pseudomonas aeruginosa]UXH68981.1 hypothetical protein N5879_32280 [Pseudomonas aeruginosa]WKL67360.1 hypothetical protein Q1Z72_01450 [Pseudomonas qingdaonensis]